MDASPFWVAALQSGVGTPEILKNSAIWYRSGRLLTVESDEAAAWGNSGTLPGVGLSKSGDRMSVNAGDSNFNGLTSLSNSASSEYLETSERSAQKFLWDGSDMLVAAVIRAANNGGNQTIAANSGVGASQPGVLFRMPSTNATVDWFTVNDSTFIKSAFSTGVADGATMVIVARYDSTAEEMTFWVNGSPRLTRDYSGFTFSTNDAALNFLIAGFSTTHLDGSISDFVGINASVSDEEALEISDYFGTLSGAYEP